MEDSKSDKIKKILDSAKLPYFLAPMFQVNDLAFRKMCRNHNILLCWTGMINSHMWSINEKERQKMFETCDDDRPLIAQLNGNEETELISCAQDIEGLVDAIDLNLGCTQHIARRGQYGYFMVNSESKRQNVIKLIEQLNSKISVPITAKIRLINNEDGVQDPNLTCEFAKSLEKAGVSLISVHGRQKQLNKSGDIDIDAIKNIVNSVSIPVIANGGVKTKEDADNLIKQTGAAGVMIGKGLLENPLILETSNPDPVAMTKEYFDLYKKYPIDFFVARRHVFHFFDSIIRSTPQIANVLKRTRSVEDIYRFLDDYSSGKLQNLPVEEDNNNDDNGEQQIDCETGNNSQ